jgi:hypothetical protein
MTKALYAHMNNKTIKKTSPILRAEISVKQIAEMIPEFNSSHIWTTTEPGLFLRTSKF